MSIYRLYLLSPLLIWAIVWFYKGNDDNRKKAFIIVYGVITFLFFSLRTPFLGSGDSRFYFNFWEKSASIPFTIQGFLEVTSVDLEKGFSAIVWLLSHVFHNGQFVFVFAGIIIAICISSFIYENCEDYVLTALIINGLGMIGFMLQGTRQAIAISICLFAYNFCRKRRLIPFLITITCACLIHASAFVFLLVYFVYGVSLNWKSICVVILCAFSYQWLISNITNLANYMMSEHYVGGSISLTTGGIYTLITYLVLIVYCLVLNNPHTCNVDENSYIEYSCGFFLLVVCTAFFSLRFFYNTVFERVCYYFIPFISIAIQSTYSRFNEKSRIVVRTLLYSFFVFWIFYKSGASSPLSNYSFFWI